MQPPTMSELVLAAPCTLFWTFLVSQGLIYYDYSDYLLDRDERELAPMFVAPLTSGGRSLLDTMQMRSENLFHECLLRLDENSVVAIAERLERLEQLQGGLQN